MLNLIFKNSLKNTKDVNEKMIQDNIFDNPACNGLGDLTVLTKEKRIQWESGCHVMKQIKIIVMNKYDVAFSDIIRKLDTDMAFDVEGDEYGKYT